MDRLPGIMKQITPRKSCMSTAGLLLGALVLMTWVTSSEPQYVQPNGYQHRDTGDTEAAVLAEHGYADQQAPHVSGGPPTRDGGAEHSTEMPSLLGESSLGGGSGARGPEQGRSASMLSSLATILPMILSSRRGETNSGTNTINVTDLLRMFGVDSNKVGTLVINAVVYIIEMVSNHFLGGSNSILESRKMDYPGAFIFRLFDTRRAEKFLRVIANPDYPINIINNLKKATGNDTVCIQQLICKLSPFWWGVNRSVRDFLPIALGKEHSSPLLKLGWKSLVMKYVPSVKDFSENSDLCETRYNGCIVMALMKTNTTHSQH